MSGLNEDHPHAGLGKTSVLIQPEGLSAGANPVTWPWGWPPKAGAAHCHVMPVAKPKVDPLLVFWGL